MPVDTTEKLRMLAAGAQPDGPLFISTISACDAHLLDEAVKEIERLRAENQKLTGALAKIMGVFP